MTVLVFGKTGQVAHELRARPQVMALGRNQVDLSDPGSCAAAIASYSPSAVINAAAYTAVDRAEEEENLATRINGDAPRAMAIACAQYDIPFVQLSTDYVFDGSGEAAWRPDDPPSPISAYGRSKLAGEDGVSRAGGRFAILRTSWVFSPYGRNFVKTMLKLAETNYELRVIADQIGGPTPAWDLAQACLAIASQLEADPSKAGVYHLSGAPGVSWADFARAIFQEAGLNHIVHNIPTSEYPSPAARPLNSRLDCRTTQEVFNITRPDWRAGLRATINQLA
ncbi:dTDP-4-dehydrorhamnose reductase [Qipengyuania sp.]|uniref:dTDP-4-dehydrorhamnose reductase n=1 Tax=Qipengyuania sp. TaxID=2004515 RepID=UPI003BAA6A8C